MTEPQAFDPSGVFTALDMRTVDSTSFDTSVVAEPGEDLRCIFLWGTNCFNCNLFKNAALKLRDQLLDLQLTWYECNVYDDVALGRRFGLHGVPAFIFYRGGKRLGRISGWPGLPEFAGAVTRLHGQTPEKPRNT